jgi:hypothetical protein
MNIKKEISHNLLNIPGWRTKRKIIVIESDDWGSIRMPSKEVYNKLLNKGYRVDLHPYEKYDSLASEEDLSCLFSILTKHKDCNGNHPVITANCVMANPDFEKIKENNFQNYYYEPFTETLKRYSNHSHSFKLWQLGLNENIFIPQFHGREHLNVLSWLDALKSKDEDIRIAFKYKMLGIFPKNNHTIGNQMMIAMNSPDKVNETYYKLMLKDGLQLFEEIFGFKSKTFIAPCYTWDSNIEETLYNNNIQGIQGIIYQSVPEGSKIRHWMGTRNRFGQYYLLRNCFFEPSHNPNLDAVDICMYRIQNAFRWGKPATISSHRINFIGYIHPKNRERNLKFLNELLFKITKKYPDVEFLSSDKLLELIKS